jgi:hypothetical protein
VKMQVLSHHLNPASISQVQETTLWRMLHSTPPWLSNEPQWEAKAPLCAVSKENSMLCPAPL